MTRALISSTDCICFLTHSIFLIAQCLCQYGFTDLGNCREAELHIFCTLSFFTFFIMSSGHSPVPNEKTLFINFIYSLFCSQHISHVFSSSRVSSTTLSSYLHETYFLIMYSLCCCLLHSFDLSDTFCYMGDTIQLLDSLTLSESA